LFVEAEQIRIERDEARESLKHITEYGTEEINAAVELRQKLAHALVDLDNMQDQRDLAMKVIKRLEQERDEAREKYDNLATEHMLVVNKICGERRDALALANQMSESNQVLMADVKHYRDKSERSSPSNNDVYLKPVLEAVTKMAVELKAERDEAREALIEIEQVFIDSDDTYGDLIKMGNIARAALEEINE
jgi:hypothetical protein